MTAPRSPRAHASAPARLGARYLLAYTALFSVTALLCLLPFALAGKSLVWLVDGLDQHFNAFVWLGSSVRGTVRGLLSGAGLVLPMWEWGLGYGGDALGTLSYYVVGDPFALISVAFPARFAEAGYAVAIVARLWCAGAALSIYARRRGCERRSTLVAALAYALGAFALYAGVRHPYFLNPLIYLPLIADALERVLDGGSSGRLALWTAVAAASNYYFLYMLLIVAALYAAIRYAARPDRAASGFARALLRSLGAIALGMGAAGAILLPSVYAFLTCSRDVGAAAVDALYPLGYYRQLAQSTFTAAAPGYWTELGMAPAGILALTASALPATDAGERRERSAQLGFLAALALCALVPFLGHALNGFGYVTNRWTFAWAFAVAAAIARWLPAYARAARRDRLRVVAASIAFCLAALAVSGLPRRALAFGLASVALLAALAWALPRAFGEDGGEHPARRFPGPFAARAATALALVASIALMARWGYVETGYLDQFRDAGSALGLMGKATSPLDAADVEDAPVDRDGAFYRLDEPSLVNVLASTHVSSTSAYWSVMPAGIGAFMRDNASYQFESYTFLSLEGRSLLLPLASARYRAVDESLAASTAVPYGYDLVGERVDGATGARSALYASSLALPFGWTSDRWVARADYDRATIAERQQMMLQGVVIDAHALESSGIEEATPVYTDEELPYRIASLSGATLEGGRLTVSGPGAAITISTSCPAGCELYVQLLDAAFEGDGSGMAGATLSWATAESGGKQGRARMLTPYDAGYDGRRDFLLNIGYADEPRNELTLTFSEPGTYEIGSLSVIAQPVAQVDGQVARLAERPLRDVSFAPNRVTGSIDLDAPRILCLSLPYSQGWSATDNGRPVELHEADGMYTGIVLTTGSHDIELTYRTPLLAEGCALSACSIAVAVAGRVLRRRREAGPHGRHLARR